MLNRNLPAPFALSQGLGGDTAAMLMATGHCKGSLCKITEYADPSLCAPRSVCMHLAVQSLHFVYGDLLRILAWLDVGKSEMGEVLLSLSRKG